MARLKSRRTLGFQEYPVFAGENIGPDVLVMIDSAGFARVAVALASNKGCVGVSVRRANNTGGASAAIQVEVEEGIFTLPGTGMVAADLLTTAYASSGVLVSGTQASNEPVAGQIRRFRTATSIDVEVGLAASKLTAS